MKKLFHQVAVELYKTFCTRGFLLCAVITCLLCFTSVVYTDSLDGKEYTVLEIIFGTKYDLHFSSYDILQMSVNPYVTLFLPVLSSIPFVTAFCAERSSGNIRFTVTRIGKYRYCIAKFSAALLSGGAAILSGFAVYGILICIFFPNPDHILSAYIRFLLGMGLYGAISVLPAFLLSSFTANQYIICCFPFIFMYFYFTVIAKIQSMLLASDHLDLLMRIDFLYPNVLKDTLFHVNVAALVYHAVLLIAVFAGFICVMNRRLDYGQ